METTTVKSPVPGTLVAVNRYIAIGIDIHTRKSILTAAGYSYAEAEAKAVERQNNNEMPYKVFNVFVWCEHTEKQVRDWLKSWGFTGSHARKVWRDVVGNVNQLIKDEVGRMKLKPLDRVIEEVRPTAGVPTQYAPRKKVNRFLNEGGLP